MHPNFFILGAQKAGTTYLAKVLSDHRDIFFSEPKELLFFQKAGLLEADYANYVQTHFSGTKDQKWLGEGSTVYFQWPEALVNIKRFVPGSPKFIICLRQPAERAVSFFIHNWRRNRYAPGTSILEAGDMRLALSPWLTGCYAPSLRRWLAAYPKENFCFMNFDVIRQDTNEFACIAAKFLEVPAPAKTPSKVVNAGLPLVWEGGQLTIAPKTSDTRERPLFRPEDLEILHRRFQADIAETEKLTGLDLSEWRKFPEFASA